MISQVMSFNCWVILLKVVLLRDLNSMLSFWWYLTLLIINIINSQNIVFKIYNFRNFEFQQRIMNTCLEGKLYFVQYIFIS